MMRRLTLLAIALGLIGASLPAQATRHELGLRLRAFERRLQAVEDAERRDPAFAEFEKAVAAFFRFDLPSVAQRVDAADRALLGREFSAAERWARSVQLQLEARLIDVATGQVTATLSQLYRPEREDAELVEPDGWTLVLHVQRSGQNVRQPQRVALAQLPHTFELSLTEVGEGDFTLRWQLLDRQGKAQVERAQGVSVAKDLAARFAAIDQAAERPKPPTPSLESLTLRRLHKLLRTMQRRRPFETRLPGVELLREAEALISADQPRYRTGLAGSFQLTVPMPKRTLPTRLFVPPKAKADAPRPIVVALHGLGGSENLFFDGYGDGLCVTLARERGWFVASPSNTRASVDVPALVDRLAERYPIDRDRVFVVGHSMGAMAAMANAASKPARLRAVAPVSGGGVAGKGEDFRALPFFVAAGTRDFGARSSKRLRSSLERAGAKVEWRGYAGADHFTVMQLSLPQVFAFFDRHNR